MPIQSTDTDSLVFTAPNQQWIVKQGVVIATTADDTQAVKIDMAGAQLLNHGDISSTGGGVFGAPGIAVGRSGAGALVVNGQTGSIIGQVAVSIRGDGTQLHNDGTIKGLGEAGVLFGNFTAGTEIRNAGDIWGKAAGIKGAALLNPTVINSGKIESDGVAILLDINDGAGRIVNTGTISGRGGAISSTKFGSMVVENDGKIIGDIVLTVFHGARVLNSGTIRGDVTLSSVADTFNGKDGTTRGDVHGGIGDDVLRGGGDDDSFYGERNADQLSGGGGDDVLVGGAKGDVLKGGRGDDTFVYTDLEDSKGGFFAKYDRDTIHDFEKGDRIDLRPIDARIGDGNQKFAFIGTADFTGKKGELRYFKDGGDAIVQADVTGDKKADLEIKLNDVARLDAQDFHL